MSKLFKFLKPYAGAVIAILCVLVVQAYCDLSLPNYTSDIVNVGIQQGGVDEKIPDVISEEDMDHLLAFLSSDQRKIVEQSYTEGEKQYDYAGKVLELKKSVTEDAGKVSELEELLGVPMLLAAGFDSDSEMGVQMEVQLKEQMQKQMQEQMQSQGAEQMQSQEPGQMQGLPDLEGLSIYYILDMMEPAQREGIVAEIKEQIERLPDMMVEQSAPLYIRGVYENVGLNTDRIQTRYILGTGGKMLALAALGMAASILVGLMASRVGAGVGRGLRRGVFRKVVGFSNGEFDKFSTASLITRSTNDIQQIQMLTVMILRMVLFAPILAIGGIYKVVQTNVDMSWIIVLAVGIIVLIVMTLFLVVMPKFKIVQEQVDRLNLVSREILTGLPVIRAFSTEKYEEGRFDTANRDPVSYTHLTLPTMATV